MPARSFLISALSDRSNTMDKTKPKVPTHLQLMNPLISALHALGGSGSIQEIYLKVLELLDLPEEIINIPHLGSNNLTEIGYRLAWARTWLKKYGVLENSRGVWTFAPNQSHVSKVDPVEVGQVVIMALALSVLATIYPSWRAARLDPVEALRYE